MKVILEIPDSLFKRAEAAAVVRGKSLKDLVMDALEAHLERQTSEVPSRGWRSVFGQARREEVESVDVAIAADLGWVNPDEWR